MTVVLAVRWVAREGESDTVEEILRRMAPLSRAEPGCVQYEVHRQADDPNTFVLFERYVDEAALEAHTREPTRPGARLREGCSHCSSSASVRR